MTKHYLTLLFLFSFCLGFAQTKDSLSIEEQARREKNIQAGNPFKEFGYTPKIATLSKGKYLEFHDLDSIVQVGSFMYNTRSKSIISIIENDTLPLSEATLKPEIISRWMSPDPLAEEFPEWSPYNFVMNNPLRFVDPLGLAPEDLILKFESEEAKTQTQANLDAGLGKGGASIDENGKVTLNVARDDLKTDEQKAFFDVINEAVDPSKSDVIINISANSEETFIGNYDTNSIDITDVNEFGNNELTNQNSILGHEIAEQTDKQRNDSGYNTAHYGSGFDAENKISGNMRMPGGTPATIVGNTASGTPILKGTDTRRYYQTSSGQTKTLEVKVRNNNVVRVKTKN